MTDAADCGITVAQELRPYPVRPHIEDAVPQEAEKQPVQDDTMRERQAAVGLIPKFCAAACSLIVRFNLLLVLLVNLGITTSLVVKYTTFNGITVLNARPPATVLYSEVVCGASILWILISFCLIRVPFVLLVIDVLFIIAWSVATILLGITLGQTLQVSCSDLALLASQQSSFAALIGVGSRFNDFGTQVYTSCNISKALFALHVIATFFFIVVAINAAVVASFESRRRARTVDVNQQNNYYHASPRMRSRRDYPDTFMNTRGPPIQQNVPEIVV